MRTLTLVAAVLLLSLTGCRSASPPPDDGGVHVRAPFVNVDVPAR
jgi:hypothetical protein